MNIPKAIIERAEEYSAKLAEYPKLSRMYKNCYLVLTEWLKHLEIWEK